MQQEGRGHAARRQGTCSEKGRVACGEDRGECSGGQNPGRLEVHAGQTYRSTGMWWQDCAPPSLPKRGSLPRTCAPCRVRVRDRVGDEHVHLEAPSPRQKVGGLASMPPGMKNIHNRAPLCTISRADSLSTVCICFPEHFTHVVEGRV